MKLTRLILGLAACAGLCACTNDEPAANGVAQETFDGDALYMVVKISDVGTSTRATDGGYQNGSSDEYAVNDAYFYFYDDAGVYVSQAEVWDGGKATENGTGNIEFEGNTVIVLKGLTTNTYPKYMVTVLNRPNGFTPGETLTEMQTKLADASGVGIIQTAATTTSAATNFTMSTSSYFDESTIADATHDNTYPFVNVLTTDNFSLESVAVTSAIPVEVYVERLAAKVELDIATLTNETITFSDGRVGYKLTETIAGDENNEGTSASGEGDEDVYIVIEGWGLNGTAKHSNIVKDITGFSTTGIDNWTGWNVPGDHRSYWGKSFNYQLGGYPTSSKGATDGTTVDTYLDYTNWSSLALALGGSTYCAENTNTVGILQTKNSSGITNVLVAATVCDAEGNALDLVRYQGELFTKTSYLNYVMSYLTATGGLNIYTLTSTDSEGNSTYTHIDGSYIQLTSDDGNEEIYDGYVYVMPVESAFTDKTFYTKDGTVIDQSETTVLETVTAALQAFNVSHDKVNAFTGGAMYYSIPIEHLNNGTAAETAEFSLLEANYGIVRNHYYVLTITAIENLGKGVYDPDEVIIPNINDDEYYYVAANIHILSWKLVSQSVEL